MSWWVWGAAECLGLGKDEDVETPTRCEALDGFVSICGGGMHALAADEAGRAFAWGSQGSLVPAEVQALRGERLVGIACGWNDSLAAVAGGDVYSVAGDGAAARKLDFPAHGGVVCMASGWRHSVVVLRSTEDEAGHNVFVWGSGRKGELGLGPSVLAADSPTLAIPLGADDRPAAWGQDPVVSVACGWRFTLALTRGGTIVGWGENKHGQLGARHDDGDGHGGGGGGVVWSATNTGAGKLVGSVTQLRCGRTHAAALNNQGELWAWGRGDMGQCGCREAVARVWPPRLVRVGEMGSKVVDFATGSEHMAAINQAGALYVWGWAEHKQLGRSGMLCTTNALAPIQIRLGVRRGKGKLFGEGVGEDSVFCGTGVSAYEAGADEGAEAGGEAGGLCAARLVAAGAWTFCRTDGTGGGGDDQ